MGTPLYSWMKLTHSSNTYAAMTPVVSRLLAGAVPDCDIHLRAAARNEPEIELSTCPDDFTFLSHNVANRHCSLQNLPIRTSECNSIGRSRPCVVTPHAIEGCLVDAIGRSMPDHQSIPLFSLARAGLWPPASMLDDQFSFTHCLFAAACAASIRLAASTSMSGYVSKCAGTISAHSLRI